MSDFENPLGPLDMAYQTPLPSTPFGGSRDETRYINPKFLEPETPSPLNITFPQHESHSLNSLKGAM